MATFNTNFESKRFFPEIRTEDGIKRVPVTVSKSTVIVETFGEKVVFTKSSRGKMFHDSRQKKQISEWELREELARLLDTKEDAERAIAALIW